MAIAPTTRRTPPLRRDEPIHEDHSTARQPAAYVRVSTLLQKQKGFSLPHQFAVCQQAALVSSAAHIPTDNLLHDADSGKTYYRTGLHTLLDKAERGELSVVYCPKVDRMGRNARDCLEILDKLHACGVELVLVENSIDTRTPMGKLFFTLLAAFAEWEGVLILERTRNGRQQKLAEGRASGTGRDTPFGYRWVPGAQRGVDGHYDRVPEQAATVLYIFEQVAAGVSSNALAAQLTRLGYTPPRGAIWHPITVRKIVRNTAYVGRLRKNVSRAERLPDRNGVRGRVVRRKNDPNDVVEIAVPPIVPEPLFALANATLATNKGASRRNARHEHLLQGTRGAPLIKCLRCKQDGRESAMVCGTRPRKTKIHRYYQCTGTHEQGKRCQLWISAEPVERAVWEALCAVLRDPGTAMREIKTLAEAGSRQARRLEADLAAQEEHERENRAAQLRLAKLASLGKIAEDIIAEQADDLERQATEIAGQLALARAQLAQAQADELPVAEIEQACRLIAQGLEAADFEQRRLIVRRLVVAVYADHERCEIIGRLPGLDTHADVPNLWKHGAARVARARR